MNIIIEAKIKRIRKGIGKKFIFTFELLVLFVVVVLLVLFDPLLPLGITVSQDLFVTLYTWFDEQLEMHREVPISNLPEIHAAQSLDEQV